MRRGCVQAGLEASECHPLLTNKNLVSPEWSRRSCKPNICVTSKAAILTLVWSFGVSTMYELIYQPSNWLSHYSDLYFSRDQRFSYIPILYALNAIVLSFYPLAGFLADNRFGRYKTITRSLQVVLVFIAIAVPFLTVFLAFLSSKRSDIIDIGVTGTRTVSFLIFFPVTVGFIGFNSNVIQFGMDQLYDSPADNQNLFIQWYVWIYYFVLFLTQIPWQLTLIFQNNSLYCLFPIYLVLSSVVLGISLIVKNIGSLSTQLE